MCSFLFVKFQSSWNQRSNEDEKIDSAGCCGESEANYLGAGELDGEKDVHVTCPVCGTIVFGDNYSINSHLGMYFFVFLIFLTRVGKLSKIRYFIPFWNLFIIVLSFITA